MNPWLWGAGLLLGAGLVRGFERDAAKEIASKLGGEGKQVAISVTYPGILSPAIGEVGTATIRGSKFETDGLPLYTEPWRSKKGTLDKLVLDLRDFRLGELRCESFQAEIPGCRFDFGLAKSKRQIRLSKSRVGKGSVRILVADLAPFIKVKYPEIQEVAVTTDGSRVRVIGKGQFLILNASFEVDAKIATDGFSLSLADCRVKMNGEIPDDASRDALVNTLNPVIHFEKDLNLLDAVFAEKVEVERDAIVVTGKVKIPDAPRAN